MSNADLLAPFGVPTSHDRRVGSSGPAVARASRLLLGAATLLALMAFVGGAATPEPVADVSEVVDPTRGWHVGVDGWQIEIDDVARSGVAPAAPVRTPADLRLAKLALYADSIGRYSLEESIDWRLVAAVIVAESGFDASALSPAGAFGLMQLKEVAARDVGVMPFTHPDANIQAGVRYLAAMRDRFPAPQQSDRLALMLAAYNMGPGHLLDAQRLARRLGRSPKRWDTIAPTLFLLEQPAIHSQLRHGYAQGAAVVRYVDGVLARYAAYRKRFPAVVMPSMVMLAEMAGR